MKFIKKTSYNFKLNIKKYKEICYKIVFYYQSIKFS